MKVDSDYAITVQLPSPAYPDKEKLVEKMYNALKFIPWVVGGGSKFPRIDFTSEAPKPVSRLDNLTNIHIDVIVLDVEIVLFIKNYRSIDTK